MFPYLSTAYKNRCPRYDDIISRSRSHSIDNYAFQGTKLDISKEILGKSVFSLSNTDRGVSMNYSLNSFSKLFSVSLFSDGSVLGKLSTSDGEGLSLTMMKGTGHKYFDIGFTKSCNYGSLSVKAINPDLECSSATFSKDRVKSVLKSLYSRVDKQSFSLQNISKIPSAFMQMSRDSIDVNSYAHSGLSSLHKKFKGGMFSVSGVLQITPSLHLGNETVFSISRAKENLPKENLSTFSSLVEQYAKEASSTCILSKVFNTWRFVGIYHTAGPAGLTVEKTVDETVSLHTEVSLDYKSILEKTKPLLSTVSCVFGATISSPSVITRVSAGSNGAATVSSDISVDDGATLNLSAQVSTNGPLLGIGFTFAS
ncbi:hypothetical protein NEMIN01_2306 [Nematocida minor]|uniref:uncharacterized protein n=1 Tax=Nematocida minor TaxID=1912983 RepID=UPI002220B4CA|nr:uncharacterized protein NEMIN01_2306 [Nematocida minor]KAI5192946.1 hypothetical protein NEMIN01_2306 [Nematocida minor]